jgi:phage gp45-like
MRGHAIDQPRRLRAEAYLYARQAVANALQYTQFTLSGASGEHDKVAGHKTEGADEQLYDYEVRRLQHFGLRSRPPKDVWTLRVAATAGSTNNVTVAEDSTRYGPSDLDDGELAIYCKVQGVVIRLLSDGSVKVTDKASSQLR